MSTRRRQSPQSHNTESATHDNDGHSINGGSNSGNIIGNRSNTSDSCAETEDDDDIKSIGTVDLHPPLYYNESCGDDDVESIDDGDESDDSNGSMPTMGSDDSDRSVPVLESDGSMPTRERFDIHDEDVKVMTTTASSHNANATSSSSPAGTTASDAVVASSNEAYDIAAATTTSSGAVPSIETVDKNPNSRKSSESATASASSTASTTASAASSADQVQTSSSSSAAAAASATTTAAAATPTYQTYPQPHSTITNTTSYQPIRTRHQPRMAAIREMERISNALGTHGMYQEFETSPEHHHKPSDAIHVSAAMKKEALRKQKEDNDNNHDKEGCKKKKSATLEHVEKPSAKVPIKLEANTNTASTKAQEALMCCICLEELTHIELSKIDSCHHPFCFGCIEKWADMENTCPLCKTRFYTIEKVHPPPPPVSGGGKGGEDNGGDCGKSKGGKRKRADEKEDGSPASRKKVRN